MIPAEMPQAFADVIRQHGGEWLGWEEGATVGTWTVEMTSAYFVMDISYLGEPFILVGRRLPDGTRSQVVVITGEHCQTLENWFYQARMMGELQKKASALYSHAPSNIALEAEDDDFDLPVIPRGRNRQRFTLTPVYKPAQSLPAYLVADMAGDEE